MEETIENPYQDVHVHAETLNCATNKCLPCIYKIFPKGELPICFRKKTQNDGVIKFPPNVRPELCPRFKLGSYSGLYIREQQILTVGDGDLSFSLSIANYCFQQQGHARNLTATTHETLESIVQTYVNGQSNVNLLKNRGVQLFHGIDATNLRQYAGIEKRKYDVVIWNFPCIRIPKGADGQVSELEQNQNLIRSFFGNIAEYLTENGEVHIAHKTIEPFSWWGIKSLAAENSFQCDFTIIFDKCNYPGYINRKVLDQKSFPCNDAQIFVFTQKQRCQENKSLPLTLVRLESTLLRLMDKEVRRKLRKVAEVLQDGTDSKKKIKKNKEERNQKDEDGDRDRDHSVKRQKRL